MSQLLAIVARYERLERLKQIQRSFHKNIDYYCRVFACFRCGVNGHHFQNCPKIWSTNPQTMETGQILVLGYEARVLNDCGGTHSFKIEYNSSHDDFEDLLCLIIKNIMFTVFVLLGVITPFLALAMVTSRRSFEESSSSDARPSTSNVPPQKKGRGRTKDHPHNHPEKGTKWTVMFDNTNQATDEMAKKLTTRMALLAKDHTLFPYDIEWRHQPQQNFQDALKILTAEYDLSGSKAAQTYINGRLNKLWRSNHNSLIKTYGSDPDMREENILATLPPYVSKPQFLNKLRQHRSEKGKQISEINTANRANQMTHHAGSKGLAQRRHELMQQGRSEVEAWSETLQMTYKGSDKVLEATEFIKTPEAKSWAESESMTPFQFIETTVNKTFGKNKKNRIIGIGEAASMVSTTNERWAAPNWKGKDPISESTTVDATPDAVWSEKFKALEVFTVKLEGGTLAGDIEDRSGVKARDCLGVQIGGTSRVPRTNGT